MQRRNLSKTFHQYPMSDKKRESAAVKAVDNIVIPTELQELNEKDLPELAEILNTLPPDKQQGIIKEIQMLSAVKQESFSGPLPHPQILRGYEDIKEGFAERILRMAEKEQDHRFECDDKMIDATISANKRGHWMGLIIAIVFAGIAGVLGFIGQTTVASIIGGLDIVSLVTVFVSNQFLNRGKDEKPKLKAENDSGAE